MRLPFYTQCKDKSLNKVKDLYNSSRYKKDFQVKKDFQTGNSFLQTSDGYMLYVTQRGGRYTVHTATPEDVYNLKYGELFSQTQELMELLGIPVDAPIKSRSVTPVPSETELPHVQPVPRQWVRKVARIRPHDDSVLPATPASPTHSQSSRTLSRQSSDSLSDSQSLATSHASTITDPGSSVDTVSRTSSVEEDFQESSFISSQSPAATPLQSPPYITQASVASSVFSSGSEINRQDLTGLFSVTSSSLSTDSGDTFFTSSEQPYEQPSQQASRRSSLQQEQGSVAASIEDNLDVIQVPLSKAQPKVPQSVNPGTPLAPKPRTRINSAPAAAGKPVEPAARELNTSHTIQPRPLPGVVKNSGEFQEHQQVSKHVQKACNAFLEEGKYKTEHEEEAARTLFYGALVASGDGADWKRSNTGKPDFKQVEINTSHYQKKSDRDRPQERLQSTIQKARHRLKNHQLYMNSQVPDYLSQQKINVREELTQIMRYCRRNEYNSADLVKLLDQNGFTTFDRAFYEYRIEDMVFGHNTLLRSLGRPPANDSEHSEKQQQDVADVMVLSQRLVQATKTRKTPYKPKHQHLDQANIVKRPGQLLFDAMEEDFRGQSPDKPKGGALSNEEITAFKSDYNKTFNSSAPAATPSVLSAPTGFELTFADNPEEVLGLDKNNHLEFVSIQNQIKQQKQVQMLQKLTARREQEISQRLRHTKAGHKQRLMQLEKKLSKLKSPPQSPL